MEVPLSQPSSAFPIFGDFSEVSSPVGVGQPSASRAVGTLLFFLLFSSFALKRKQPASGAGHGAGLKDEMSGFQGLRYRSWETGGLHLYLPSL